MTRNPLLLALAMLALAGCQYLPRMPSTADVEVPADSPGNSLLPTTQGSAAGNRPSRAPLPAGRREGGADIGTGFNPALNRQAVRRGPGGIEISLMDAEVRDVVRLLLSDILGRNFIIAEDVRGRLSVQTARGIDQSEVLPLLDGLLNSIGATAVDSGSVIQIMRRQNARAVGSPVTGPSDRQAFGFVTEIIPLRFIGVAEFRRVLDPLVREALVLSQDEARNILVVSGPAREIETVREAARTFDQDWLSGRAVALVPLRNARPADVVRGLSSLFGVDEGGTSPVIRIRPIERLNAVLIVATRPELLRRAESWTRTFDQTVEGDEPRMFVYRVQARRAGELANVLDRLMGGQGSAAPDGDPLRDPGSSQAGLGGGLRGNDGASGFTGAAGRQLQGAQGFGQGMGQGMGQGGGQGLGQGLTQGGGQGGSQGGAQAGGQSGTAEPGAGQLADTERLPRVVADEGNNALLIYGTPFQFREISSVLQQLDVLPAQALIQASVIEVTLNDNLRFGVQYFLQNADSNFLMTTAPAQQQGGTSGNSLLGQLANVVSLVPQAPGFAYFLGYQDRVRLLVEALSQVTQARIVSAPRMAVMDRQLATIQVGDQVPIATQQLTTQTTVAPTIVNSIALRDTGVILRVRPRIGAGGAVTLEIEQEVSDVVPTTSSQLNSPTIRQRRARTVVSVQDGETVAVGGMIRDAAQDTRTGIPVLNRIPYIGALFGTTGGQRQRTELLIVLTATVIRDAQGMREATDELRSQMRAISSMPRPPGAPWERTSRERLAPVASPR